MDVDTRLSVLLIDSNDTDRTYYAERLRLASAEYLIHEAVNGQTGLTIYKSQHIDCVILEIDLSDMSGFEVLLHLVPVARKAEVAVVVLTHLSNPYLIDLVLKNGAVACLLKNGASGDDLDKAVLKAVSMIQRDRKKHLIEQTAPLVALGLDTLPSTVSRKS
jgi:DNA-binding NarL/FixJ family response regulator